MPDADTSPPAAKIKSKKIPIKTINMWEELVAPGSHLFAEVIENEARCDDLLMQLGSSVRNGVLSDSSPAFRTEVLNFFERNCVRLCRGSDVNRLRMIYETLRDYLGNPSRDGTKTTAQLRDAAIKSLTSFIIAVDLPRKDSRLTRFHVEFLYRLLNDGDAGKPKTGMYAAHGRMVLAAECLQMLEIAYPMLLSLDATAFMALAAKEVISPTPGCVHTQLAATVVYNLAATHLTQQEEYVLGNGVDNEIDELLLETVGSLGQDALSSDSDEDDGTEEVLAAAAEVLCSSDTKRHRYNDVDEVVVSVECSTPSRTADGTVKASGSASPDSSSPKSPASPDGASPSNSSPGASQRKEKANGISGLSSPRAILATSSSTASMPSIPSKQSSRMSMLASVAELDEMESTAASDWTSLDTQRTAPDLHLNVNLKRTESDAGAMTWTAISTPRSMPSEMVLLQRVGTGTGAQLRRFAVPLHIQTSNPGAVPRLMITSEAQAALQDAAQMFLGAMRRLDPSGVARMTKLLPPILRVARPSSSHFWPVFERQLSTGSTPLLRAVLDLHDALPELFEGRSPSLVEKVLVQVNDESMSVDHRVAGASWVLRQHAQQRHTGAALLLADSWEQLLPRSREPLQLVTVKVKALGACLSAGIGDEEVVCRSVCGWEGYSWPYKYTSSGEPTNERKQRAFTYALRILHSSAPATGPAAHRAHACLIAATMDTIVARPQLVPAVDAFLESCPREFAVSFLRAMDAMLAGVDGQFEVFRLQPLSLSLRTLSSRDLTNRMTSTVLKRSSSLVGLVRGLSFKLSFSLPSQTHLDMPLSARGAPRQREQEPVLPLSARPHYGAAENVCNDNAFMLTPRAPVNVNALRNTISSVFQRGGVAPALTPGGQGPSGRSIVTSTMEDSLLAEDLSSGEEETVLCPAVPLNLPTQTSVDTWTSSPTTWAALATGLLSQDLMAYRLLLKRVLRTPEVHPTGTLHALGKYTWQYKEYQPSHALSAKEAGWAVLGLCHAAALVHLPCENDAWWSQRQVEVSEDVQNVLNALQDGFPVPMVQTRSQSLSKLLAREAGWSGEAWQTTLQALLNGYIDSAVQG